MSDREITAYFENNDTKDTLIFEQYKPDHIIVVLPANGEYVQVMKNKNGLIDTITYRDKASEAKLLALQEEIGVLSKENEKLRKLITLTRG
jgi:hypothetical protein